jgi:Fe-S cluster assembly protein SufD
MGSALLDSLLAGSDDRQALPAWWRSAQREAAEGLRREGLPGARDEAWKYTSLRALEQRSYVAGDAAAAAREVETQLLELPGIAAPRLVFVNGSFRSDLSRLPDIDGVQCSSLRAALRGDAEPVRFLLARRFRESGSAFARLNTAMAGDGALLRVAAGVVVREPVQIVYIGAPAPADVAWHARALVELGRGASLNLVERHLASAPNAHLGNLVAQYWLGAQAQLGLVQVQNAADGSSLIRRSEFALDEGAALSLHTLEIGAQWARHDLHVDLAGARSRVSSRGVFALRARQHADTHLDVRHSARDTTSDMLWRGVADQRARGVFRGAITVAAGADGADARLSNKNLLLSAQAEIDTQPVLEIHADEVKAAHGATVGQLDQQALFYLRSRGVPAALARTLLIAGFCREALDAIPDSSLRAHVNALLDARLPQPVEPA